MKNDAVPTTQPPGPLCSTGPNTFPTSAGEVAPRKAPQSALQWDRPVHQTFRGECKVFCALWLALLLPSRISPVKYLLSLTRTREMPRLRQEQRPVKSGWRERWVFNLFSCTQQPIMTQRRTFDWKLCRLGKSKTGTVWESSSDYIQKYSVHCKSKKTATQRDMTGVFSCHWMICTLYSFIENRRSQCEGGAVLESSLFSHFLSLIDSDASRFWPMTLPASCCQRTSAGGIFQIWGDWLTLCCSSLVNHKIREGAPRVRTEAWAVSHLEADVVG